MNTISTATRVRNFSLLLGTAAALSALVLGCSDDSSEMPAGSAGMGGSGGTAGMGGSGGTAGMGGSGGTAGMGGSGGTAGMGGSGGSSQGGKAKLRVVHASATAPAVDIYAKGQTTPLVSALGYGKATAYLELPEGTYDLELRATGSQPSSPAAYEVSKLAIKASMSYTALAAGDLGSTADADKFRVIALQDGFEKPATGSARVRIVHAGFDAPTVDLDVGNDDPSKPELSGLARFADTGAAGVPLPSGKALQVGIAAGGKTVTAFTTPSLPDNGELLLVAAGRLGLMPRNPAGFALLVVLPDGTTAWLKQNPFVYALHASPNAPAVDIYAGAAEIFDNVAFGQLGRVQVPAGTYTLDFYAGKAGPTVRPSETPVVSAATPALAAGETYVGIATGLLGKTGSGAFGLIAIAEGFGAEAANKARLRLVHASPDAPQVDIGLASQMGSLDANPPVKGLSFLSSTDAEGLELPAAKLTFGVAAAGTTKTVAEFDLTLMANQRVIAVAAGLLAPKSGEPGFRLLAIDATSTNITQPWAVATVSPK